MKNILLSILLICICGYSHSSPLSDYDPNRPPSFNGPRYFSLAYNESNVQFRVNVHPSYTESTINQNIQQALDGFRNVYGFELGLIVEYIAAINEAQVVIYFEQPNLTVSDKKYMVYCALFEVHITVAGCPIVVKNIYKSGDLSFGNAKVVVPNSQFGVTYSIKKDGITQSTNGIYDNFDEKYSAYFNITDTGTYSVDASTYVFNQQTGVYELTMGPSPMNGTVSFSTPLYGSKPNKTEIYNGTNYNSTYNYYDNLGQLEQAIEQAASPTGMDVVQAYVYDQMGRNSVNHLPFVVGQNSGVKVTDAVNTKQVFYNTMFADDTDAAYTTSETRYDTSPLGLVLAEGGIGKNDNLTTGHPVQYEYRLNNALDNIRFYRTTENGGVVLDSYCADNTLCVRKTYRNGATDSESSESYEYTNSQGQVIAREVRVSMSDRRITYTVFDDMGRERYLIPPIAEAQVEKGITYTIAYLKKFCYYTEYDERGLPVRKWIPGAGCSSYVHDTKGRLIMSQDAKMVNDDDPTQNRWAFIKYDNYDRPILKGIVTMTGTAEELYAAMEAKTTENHLLGESRGTALCGYTNDTYPTNITASDVLNISYYDDYSWPGASNYTFSTADALYGVQPTTKSIIGCVTGTKTKVLGADAEQWLTTTSYYDKDYNAIQTISDLYPSGREVVSNKHNYVGQVTHTKVKQTIDSTAYEYNKSFDYDVRGRLLAIRQTITGDAQGEVILASYTYDELDNVATKSIHNSMETTANTYDIKGRLVASTSPSFSYKVGFDKSVMTGINGRTDGSISNFIWAHSATKPNVGYTYSYDKVGQLIYADYKESINNTWSTSDKYRESVSEYDLNGNIKAIVRNSDTGDPLHEIDYRYESPSNGNALTSVTLNNIPSEQFLYDKNGNMIYDGLKGVNIEYNILDLPSRIFAGTEYIRYIYDGNGTKLGSVVGGSSTYYRSVMVYSQNGSAAEELNYMLHPEGLVAKEGASFTYKYFKTDYLGNTRAMLAASDTELVSEQITDYYPFGIAHEISNLHLNRYLLGGKEFQDASIGLGGMLGLYDFHARYYNPVLGRWFNIDPALQLANPYLYCGNNPVMYIDPDGQFIWLIVGGAALVGAYFGGVKESGSYNPFKWDWDSGALWRNMGFGAAIGAASAGAGSLAAGAVAPMFATQTGFAFGASVGAASGFAAGFTGGLLNGIVSGQSIGDAIVSGLTSGAFGAATGFAIGGVTSGVQATKNGSNFWNGKANSPIISNSPSTAEITSRLDAKISPYEKGQLGVARAEQELTQQGHTIIGKEVSYRVEGSNVPGRIDIMTKSHDVYNFIEVKNGPHASFTANQKINYPLIEQGMKVTPYGNKLQVPSMNRVPINVNMKHIKY